MNRNQQHLTIFYKAVMSVNFNCNVWSVKYVWNFFFWSVNYSNLVYKVCITFWKCQDTQTLFMLQVLIYRKTYFKSLLLFSYICWSVNCMSWISKFNNLFLTFTETKARFIFEGFNIVHYRKFISVSLILFLILFIWSVNCLRDFFSHFVSQ